MAPASRRNFLALAGAGAAGVGISSAVGGLAGSGTLALAPSGLAEAPPGPVSASLSGSLVVVVDDVHGDELSLLIGDEEIVVSDRALIARLARAAGRASTQVV